MNSTYRNKPEPLFELVVHDIARKPGFTVGDAGYENNEWRYKSIADYLMDWLLEFAMKYSTLEDVNSATAANMLNKAARTVYTTDKYGKRGEFGELLLHAFIRQTFDSEPAISKIYYKTSANDTVKGFDAVHVVENDNKLELWLGEVKFYKDANSAIKDVVEEIKDHTDHDYLRSEFILISGKIDDNWPHAQQVKRLMGERISLDKVFEQICIPVLLTYESNTISEHKVDSDLFKDALVEEVESLYKRFTSKPLPPLKIHLFLIPLGDKSKLVDILNKKLEGLQR
jgi:hypothetical protein